MTRAGQAYEQTSLIETIHMGDTLPMTISHTNSNPRTARKCGSFSCTSITLSIYVSFAGGLNLKISRTAPTLTITLNTVCDTSVEHTDVDSKYT